MRRARRIVDLKLENVAVRQGDGLAWLAGARAV